MRKSKRLMSGTAIVYPSNEQMPNVVVQLSGPEKLAKGVVAGRVTFGVSTSCWGQNSEAVSRNLIMSPLRMPPSGT